MREGTPGSSREVNIYLWKLGAEDERLPAKAARYTVVAVITQMFVAVWMWIGARTDGGEEKGVEEEWECGGRYVTYVFACSSYSRVECEYSK